ncbi:MAG: alanine--glyoxylate aminotransferase family protein [Dehalococcoidia bacterium]|nr:alanine--glyoxylate aminotransferase family protein [Dehalococcoidia bacterium]
MQLRIPGPTPLPDEVLQAMKRQMINHRGPQFAEMFHEVTATLKEMFQTKGDLLILTGSGTGGMEASIVNTLSPGDKVLSLSNGAFGERFADIAEAFGAQVERLRFEWGRAVDPQAVRQALSHDTGIKAVLVTHNETSTGVTNDLASISAVVREFEKLLLVDAISSLGAIDLPVDAWGCDVVITGSQKAWMAPPGLAMVSVSERAWQAHAQARMPRCYWDFARAKRFLEKGQTPWTPALSTIYALAAALELLQREGLKNIVARHARVGAKAREGVKSLGLSLFPEDSYASNTVTAVRAPEGLDVKRLLKSLREEYNTILAGGQQRLEGKIFRIGHLGYVNEDDIEAVLEALRVALPQAGFNG